MTLKYRAIIFDLDGTILDTLDDLMLSVNFALNTHNLPTRDKDEIRSFVGNGIQSLIKRAVPTNTDDTTTNKVFDTFKEYYAIHCADNTKPYADILKLLSTLKVSNYLLAVVSNKADFAVQTLCKNYFNDTFDYVVGAREHIAKKPAPDSVNEVLAHFNLKANDAVYIGDSEVDIMTAANANMDCISVSWGFRERDCLSEHNAQVIVDSPLDILTLV